MKYGEQYSIKIQILSEKDKKYIEEFSCGNSSIDMYFRSEAISDRTSVTYLFIDKDDDKLMGNLENPFNMLVKTHKFKSRLIG